MRGDEAGVASGGRGGWAARAETGMLNRITSHTKTYAVLMLHLKLL